MILKSFKCIRIEDSVKNKFLLSIKYKDLIEITEINKLSVNRIVDEEKAEKMISFIEEEKNFYPTIMMVTEEQCDIKYDDDTAMITLKSNKDKLLGIVDGQHRYKSIELMLNKEGIIPEEKMNILKEKEQTVFLISNFTKQDQRNLFLEINSTPNKVKKGTQLRLDITTYNYYGLKFLNENEKYLDYINFDEDQVLKKYEKRIPFKFILKGNEELLKSFEKDYVSNKLNEDDINKYYSAIEYLWRYILDKMIDYIKTDEKLKKSIYSLEIYYIAIFRYIKKTIGNTPIEKDIMEKGVEKIKSFFDINPIELKSKVDLENGNTDKINKIIKEIEENEEIND